MPGARLDATRLEQAAELVLDRGVLGFVWLDAGLTILRRSVQRRGSGRS